MALNKSSNHYIIIKFAMLPYSFLSLSSLPIDYGRLWTKHEAFQLILQAQSDALISKGADPSIKVRIHIIYLYY